MSSVGRALDSAPGDHSNNDTEYNDKVHFYRGNQGESGTSRFFDI